MKTNNGDLPANPTPYADMGVNGGKELYCSDTGLTKREMFCLHHGVADTGDAELDAIITKGNRQKVAISIMQGLMYSRSVGEMTLNRCIEVAIKDADALLAALEKWHER